MAAPDCNECAFVCGNLARLRSHNRYWDIEDNVFSNASFCADDCQWLHIWTSTIHDINTTTSWTDTATQDVKGTNTPVTGTTVVPKGTPIEQWPAPAQVYNRQSPIANRQSPITNHQYPLRTPK